MQGYAKRLATVYFSCESQYNRAYDYDKALEHNEALIEKRVKKICEEKKIDPFKVRYILLQSGVGGKSDSNFRKEIFTTIHAVLDHHPKPQ